LVYDNRIIKIIANITRPHITMLLFKYSMTTSINLKVHKMNNIMWSHFVNILRIIDIFVEYFLCIFSFFWILSFISVRYV